MRHAAERLFAVARAIDDEAGVRERLADGRRQRRLVLDDEHGRAGERCEVGLLRRHGGALQRRAADGKLDVERRARAGTRRKADPAAVLLHDRIRHGQAEARALADFLRREERIEDLRLQLLGDSRAVIVDLEHHRLPLDVVPAAHDERAAAVRRQHRLLGVDDQVQQHLLHLMLVGEDLRKPRRPAHRRS